jgi:hypothetical protein
MATWELEDELKKQFPVAPTWGEAGFQDRRNVRKPSAKASEETEGEDMLFVKEAKANDGPNSARPKRALKPNPLYFGPSWGHS